MKIEQKMRFEKAREMRDGETERDQEKGMELD